jgi:hypothetical protein
MASELEDRLRKAMTGRRATEQKMFGGTCFHVGGNMAICASKRGLLVRVGADGMDAALKRAGTRPMEMRGRAMTGYLYVDDTGTRRDSDIKAWVERAVAFAITLPPKAKKPPAKKASAKPAPKSRVTPKPARKKERKA